MVRRIIVIAFLFLFFLGCTMLPNDCNSNYGIYIRIDTTFHCNKFNFRDMIFCSKSKFIKWGSNDVLEFEIKDRNHKCIDINTLELDSKIYKLVFDKKIELKMPEIDSVELYTYLLDDTSTIDLIYKLLLDVDSIELRKNKKADKISVDDENRFIFNYLLNYMFYVDSNKINGEIFYTTKTFAYKLIIYTKSRNFEFKSGSNDYLSLFIENFISWIKLPLKSEVI